jgi:hypothetical protein
MDFARQSSGNFDIWIIHLIECAKIAESSAIPFTDLFGIETFARCMKMKSGTIKDHMNAAEIKAEKIDGVTEAIYHAADIARVFGRV